MQPEKSGGISLQVSDVTKQKMANVRDIPPDSSVGELVQSLLDSLKLPADDAGGRPIVYAARLEREGRHLHSSERIGDAVLPGDQITLQPSLDAGGFYR